MLSTKEGQSESGDSLVEILEFMHFARIFKWQKLIRLRMKRVCPCRSWHFMMRWQQIPKSLKRCRIRF